MQVSLHQKRESTPTGYKITNTLSGGISIDDELFLFKYADNSYVHVTTVDDIYRYPTTKTEGYDYYRSASSVHEFEVLGEAISHAAAQKSALAELVPAYSAAVASFVGEEDTDYTDA